MIIKYTYNSFVNDFRKHFQYFKDFKIFIIRLLERLKTFFKITVKCTIS